MYCLENEDFDVTDEFGFSLETYYYEIAAHDIDSDNKKENILLTGDKKANLVVCVLKVGKKKGKLKFGVQDVYHGEQYAYIDKNNNVKIVE